MSTTAEQVKQAANQAKAAAIAYEAPRSRSRRPWPLSPRPTRWEISRECLQHIGHLREEFNDLRKQLAELAMERDVLMRSLALWAKGPTS